MTRTRSRSIVEKIASDIPSYKNLQSHQDTPDIIKSRSFDSFKAIKTIPNDTKLHPFSEKEASKIWDEYIEAFNYDCLIDLEDIENINKNEINEIYNFRDNCEINTQQLRGLIDDTDSLISAVDSLKIKYNQISNETIDFDKESNKLLSLQNGFVEKFTQIETYLKNFENLEIITKNLSKSGYNLINKRFDFFKFSILNQLDDSLVFFDQHPTFKNVDLYISRFRQCLTKALTLIRNYLINELKRLNEAFMTNIQNVSIDLILYNEFNTYIEQNKFNELTQEILKRVSKHNEYQGLYNDVLKAYFKVRLTFLKIYLTKNFIPTDENDLVQTCQDRISFFKTIIEKEFKLFKLFFVTKGTRVNKPVIHEFYNFLTNVLDPLYDSLRLLILRETNINNLCNLTTLLQKYYEFEDPPDELVFDSINYGDLFQSILSDVQSRLIFRIQIYIDEKLLHYVPTIEDLKLSERYIRTDNSRSSSTKESGSRKGSIRKGSVSINTLDIDYPINLFKDVYLPLGKALTLLSSIYELINSVVFDDLAHYIVHSCIILLKGEFYKKSLTYLGAIDTKLNYFKNLMILSEHLSNFDIQFVKNEVTIDFTGGFYDIWNIIRTGQIENSGGIFELFKRSIPKIVNDMMDAKYEVQSEMAKAYTEFRDECTDEIMRPILFDLATKDALDELLSKFSTFKENLSKHIPSIYKKVKTCMNDENTTKSVMTNIIVQITVYYQGYYAFITEEGEPIDEIMTANDLELFAYDLLSEVLEGDKIEFNEGILG